MITTDKKSSSFKETKTLCGSVGRLKAFLHNECGASNVGAPLGIEGCVSGRTADHTFLLVAPVLLGLADVGLVAELGHLLGLGEEFLGLADGLEGLCVVSTHGNLSYVYITVGSSDHTQILLADALTLSGALCDACTQLRSNLLGLVSILLVLGQAKRTSSSSQSTPVISAINGTNN